MTTDVDVVAVNRTRGLALTKDDRALVITSWLDFEGDTTADRDNAKACIATDGTTWWAIDLAAFTQRPQ